MSFHCFQNLICVMIYTILFLLFQFSWFFFLWKSWWCLYQGAWCCWCCGAHPENEIMPRLSWNIHSWDHGMSWNLFDHRPEGSFVEGRGALQNVVELWCSWGLDCWVFFTSALSFVFVFLYLLFEFNGTVIFLVFEWLFSFTVRTTNKQTRSQLWNTQIIYYLCMKKHKCTFSTFPHFQGWPPQDLQQAGVSTCCDGFGTKSSPKFVFNQSF